MTEDRLFRNVSDTALWAAVYRAEESRRPGALFVDPFAEKLAGARGRQIFAGVPKQRQQTWAWVTRTVLFDSFITAELARGADMVVNLAAGLDARPYRMALPASLPWVEVDLPEILTYKAEVLKADRPTCALERVSVDLADAAARRDLFTRLSVRARQMLILSEGLLLYLPPDDVGTLAEDLASHASIHRWVTDLASPGLLKMIQKEIGPQLAAASAPPRFAPEESTDFFIDHGWRAVEVRSMLKSAKEMYPLPPLMRFFALFPERKYPRNQPWSGVCVLEKDIAR